jgi:hypothetical protein
MHKDYFKLKAIFKMQTQEKLSVPPALRIILSFLVLIRDVRLL